MDGYILIWYINDYPEMGGGAEHCFLKKLSGVEEKVNELKEDDRITILFCGELCGEIKFKAKEKVTRWEAEK